METSKETMCSARKTRNSRNCNGSSRTLSKWTLLLHHCVWSLGMRRGTRPKRRRPPLLQATQSIDFHMSSSSCVLPDEASLSAGRQDNALQCLNDGQPVLEPITTFSPIQGPSSVVANSSNINKSIISNSTVIEMLIFLLCREYETDARRREKLFRALCSVVKQWNKSFYLPLHDISEFQQLHSSLLKTFERFLRNAQSQLFSRVVALPRQISLIPLQHQALLDDRYSREFIEVEELGRGGFGVVVKAKNRLDEKLYAIKIVTVRQEETEITLREVQALANLDHPHIVRYHCTWLQFYLLPRHHLPRRDHPSGKLARRPRNPRKVQVVGKTTSTKINELSRSSEKDNKIEELCSESCRKDFKCEKFFYKSYIQRTLSAIYENTEYSKHSKTGIANDRGLDCISQRDESDFEFNKDEKVLGNTIFQLEVRPFFQPNQYVNGKQKDSSSSDDDGIVFRDSQSGSHHKGFVSPVKLSSSSSSNSYLEASSSSQKSTSSKDDEVLSRNYLYFNESATHSKLEEIKTTSSVGADCKALALTASTASSSLSLPHPGTNISKKIVVSYNYHGKGKRLLQKQPKLSLFIQMGLCGESLSDWLQQRNTNRSAVDRCECLKIFQQMLSAVQYIHSQNMIHRDIKPANIFFTRNQCCNIQLGDFGLARSLSSSGASESVMDEQVYFTPIDLTPRTQGVGTPIYAAPEIGLGGRYDAKSDMHNLGVILLELFQPFTTESERINVINALKTKRSLGTDLFDQWPDIASWILKLTHPEPSQRPSSVEILESSLFRASESSSIKKSSLLNHSAQLSNVLAYTSTSKKSFLLDVSSHYQQKSETQHKDYSASNYWCRKIHVNVNENVALDSQFVEQTSDLQIQSSTESSKLCEYEQLFKEKEREVLILKAENIEIKEQMLQKEKENADLKTKNYELHLLVANLQKRISTMNAKL